MISDLILSMKVCNAKLTTSNHHRNYKAEAINAAAAAVVAVVHIIRQWQGRWLVVVVVAVATTVEPTHEVANVNIYIYIYIQPPHVTLCEKACGWNRAAAATAVSLPFDDMENPKTHAFTRTEAIRTAVWCAPAYTIFVSIDCYIIRNVT